MKKLIRPCTDADVPTIFQIINDAARAYSGVIPDDCMHDPYMSPEELAAEIGDGVEFAGYEVDGTLVGVMGRQDRGEVMLIRHAYVRTVDRGRGIGTLLLHSLEHTTAKPILIGTWGAAAWAIRFYEKNGYRLLPRAETVELLHRYWNVPERQIEVSVVLANDGWR